ncbi:hypothetical protein COOONC_04294 [Cooperia oncophora]
MEMNRLRSMIKDRMSNNAKKYFEPLLKIADEKEQKVSQVVSGAGSSKLLAAIPQGKSKSSEKVDSLGKEIEHERTSNEKKGTSSLRVKRMLDPTEASQPNQKPTLSTIAGLLKSVSNIKITKNSRVRIKRVILSITLTIWDQRFSFSG